MKLSFYTLIALIAFAGNSVLCRLALGTASIDAASFTEIRLISGMLVLAVLLKLSQPKTNIIGSGRWSAALMLFVYAISFSFAYTLLETGTGALVLFGAVQITMILASVIQGNRLQRAEWIGLIIAFCGLVYLVLPGLGSPSFSGLVLMLVSGFAWATYTLLGKQSINPLQDTTGNFIRTLPLVLVLIGMTYQEMNISPKGLWLAVLSGGLASGIGYAIWYHAVKQLTKVQAGVVQLFVPVIAGIGGLVFAHEIFTLRFMLATLMISGGTVLVLLAKRPAEEGKR